MKDALAPLRLHVFVCANRREPENALGSGCGDRGEALYQALKVEVLKRGLIRETWIAKTHCLGICPKEGATITRYPPRGGHPPVETGATLDDVDAILSPGDSGEEQTLETNVMLREVESLEALQRKKVLDLARRLNPKLTLEDVQNPHDFPELDDPDWHYADGVLTGIASVKSALLALLRQRQERDDE